MIIINMIVSTLIGILAGLGVGGGGLLVIYLTMVSGMEQLSAQGINLVFFIFCAAASLFVHLKRRNINIKRCLALSTVGIAASIPGIMLSHSLDTHILRKIFGALLIFSGITVLLHRKKKK